MLLYYLDKGVMHEGDKKLVDDEHRRISSLPHMIFTDNPKKYKQDGEQYFQHWIYF